MKTYSTTESPLYFVIKVRFRILLFLFQSFIIFKMSFIKNIFTSPAVRPKLHLNSRGLPIGAAFPMEKGFVTPRRSVPNTVDHPNYSMNGRPFEMPNEIYLYDDESLPQIRAAAKLARKMLDFANSLVQPGITTEEIDILTHNEIIKNGAYPSPVNFRGFPKAICTSVNEVNKNICFETLVMSIH